MSIQPTLFIGIGTTGVKVLDYLQRETFAVSGSGNLFGLFQYLAFETDSKTETRGYPGGDDVRDSICKPSTGSAHNAFNELGRPSWCKEPMPGGDAGLSAGAGHKRATGLLYFQHHCQKGSGKGFTKKLTEKIDELGSADWAKKENYVATKLGVNVAGGLGLIENTSIDVYIIASLAGGTGSGVFGGPINNGENNDPLLGVIGQIMKVNRGIKPIGIFLIPHSGHSDGTNGSKSDIRKANSIASIRDEFNRSMVARPDMPSWYDWIAVASPVIARPSGGKGTLLHSTDAYQVLCRLTARFLLRAQTVANIGGSLVNEAAKTGPLSTLSIGIGGIHFPLPEIREAAALHATSNWLDDWITEKPKKNPNEAFVREVCESLVRVLLEDANSQLANVPLVQAKDNNKWDNEIYPALKHYKRFYINNKVRQELRKLLSRLVKNRPGSVLSNAMYLLDRIENQIGPHGPLGNVEYNENSLRRALRSVISERLPIFIRFIDGNSYNDEIEVWIARCVVSWCRDVIMKEIDNAREHCRRIIERLRTEKRMVDDEANVVKGESELQTYLTVTALGSVTEDISYVVSQCDMPDRKLFQTDWFDDLEGGNGASAFNWFDELASGEEKTGGAAALKLRKYIFNIHYKRVTDITKTTTDYFKPQFTAIQPQTVWPYFDKADFCMLETRSGIPVQDGPFAGPPVFSTVIGQLPGVPPPPNSRYNTSVLQNALFPFSVEHMVLRNNYAPDVLEIAHEEGVKKELDGKGIVGEHYNIERYPYLNPELDQALENINRTLESKKKKPQAMRWAFLVLCGCEIAETNSKGDNGTHFQVNGIRQEYQSIISVEPEDEIIGVKCDSKDLKVSWGFEAIEELCVAWETQFDLYSVIDTKLPTAVKTIESDKELIEHLTVSYRDKKGGISELGKLADSALRDHGYGGGSTAKDIASRTYAMVKQIG